MLEVSNVTKRFGGVTAVDRVSFRAARGEVTALVGPNGAGKSTLLNVIAGEMAPTEGRVRLDERQLSGRAPHVVARAGVARTFQHSRLVAGLTVEENILVAVRGQSWRWPGRVGRRRDRADADRIRDVTHEVGVDHLREQLVHQLDYGSARLVEVARALVREPGALLLDEPAAGLNPTETLALGEMVAKVTSERGIVTLLVEHDLGLVRRLSSTMVVLNFGSTVARGTPDEVCADQAVIEAYIGTAR